MNHERHTDHALGRFLKRTTEKRDTLAVVAVLLLIFVGFLITRGATPASSELSYIEYSPLGQEAGSVVPASCDSKPLPGSHFNGDCVALCPSGSGYYDRYFDPSASTCGPACVANVGQTCYLSNSCGQKSAAGIIQCDGTCGNKLETDILTPSKHYVGTFDDFRGGYEGGICTLAGRPAWTGNYACAPDLNSYGCTNYDKSGVCSEYGVTAYYAESRHNGNWGSFAAGQGLCAETGIKWIECGPAISAPPDSNCPASPLSPTNPGTPTTPDPNTPDPNTPVPPVCDTSQGSACTSPANSCGKTQSDGTIQCDGSCSSTAPAETTCPPMTPIISALWQGSSYLGPSGLAYASNGYQVLAQATSPYGSNLNYYFEWQAPGDTAAAQWSGWTGSGGWGSVNHYADYRPGVYYVRAAAYDDTNRSSAWSDWLPITLTIPPLSVSCAGAPGNPYIGQPVTWNSSVVGGSGSYIYVWSGTEDLWNTNPTAQKAYATAGPKQASLSVTDSKSGETASATCTNSETGGASINVQACTASLTASPSTIEQGETTSLSWTVSGGFLCASSCSGGTGFDTGGAISGIASPSSLPTPPTTSYTLSCVAGTYGPPPSANATVTVIAPDVTFTVNNQGAGGPGGGTPPRVDPAVPNNVSLSWSPANPSAVACTITKNGLPWKSGLNGSGVTDSVTVQTTYTIDCRNKLGFHVTKSIVVNVLVNYNEF